MKNRIGELIVQIISVMIGVTLGFLISNWSQNKREKSKSDLLMKNISSEIQINKDRVEQVINYHRILRDSSRYYLKKELLNESRPNFFRGVNTLTLTNSAFETGIQTGLIHEVSLDKIQALNNVYTKQRAYEDFANLLLSGLITMDYDDDERFARKMLMYLSISMTDIVIKEEQLLRNYDKALGLIN